MTATKVGSTFMALCLACVVAFAGCASHAPPPLPPPSPSPTPTPKPMATDPLNGALVDPPALRHRVAAVIIDNYPIDARPQSGLHDAEIVYEVEAEGGVTRYLALFLSATPAKIGPVRSARTYFVDLARPYNALFAHAGGNDDVWGPLKDLREQGFADMEEIVGTSEAFWRDSSRDMPHNLYTSVAKLRAAAPNHGWPDAMFAGTAFSFENDPAPPAAVDLGLPTPPPAPVASATLTFWNRYAVEFRRSGAVFERSIGGVVQHDRDDPRPYQIADIIAVWIPARVLDELGDLAMPVYGEFPAAVVRPDGVARGRWIASGPGALPQLVDDADKPLPLAPGQIYIEILPQGGSLDVGKVHLTH